MTDTTNGAPDSAARVATYRRRHLIQIGGAVLVGLICGLAIVAVVML